MTPVLLGPFSFTHRTTILSIGPISDAPVDQDVQIADATEPEQEPEPFFQPPKEPEDPEDPDSDSDEEDKDNMPQPTEIKIGQPEPYDGNRENATRFVAQVSAYLDLNDEIYNTDKKKIIFTLSFMKTGTVGTWMEDFVMHANQESPTTPLHQNGFGTFKEFTKKFSESFFPIDEPGTALHQLHGLKQKEDLSEYMATFNSCVGRQESPASLPRKTTISED
jgi:hypothetical protein